MSTGGIFTLITNDGKQDRMLMATELLRARLARIAKARYVAGLDPTPTLVDIEKTHVLFMNAHFKPFAAIGYEYNKVRASSGATTLNSTVQFSIPQFGDFFHDMVLHVRLNAVTISTPASQTWRWCAYPGERLLEKVRFTVNGNPLDEYYSQDYNFYRQFELGANKVTGYNRCAGQQELIPAVLDTGLNAAGVTTAPSALGGATTASRGESTAHLWVHASDGYQTLKTGAGHNNSEAGTGHVATDVLEVTMPLLFWFNKDPRLSIPSVSIPFGQRFVEVDLTAFGNLAQEVQDITDGSTLSDGAITAPTVDVCELYVNNIFVNPEVHDIFIKRIGFNLIRVHRRQATRVTSLSGGEVLLNNFKWPIESIYFGFRDTAQSVATDNARYLDGWCNFAQSHIASITHGPTGALATASWITQIPVVNRVTFLAHGIPIYNEIPAVMYNQYFPLVRGEKLNTPTDLGAYCVMFNLYPGVYQPSGHINVSRAREFYVKFDNSAANSRTLGSTDSTDFDLLASANALNFLLISDGSAVLRYST